MGLDVGTIRLCFESSELFALAEVARKNGTDIGSILRIGGRLVLEADRRGLLRVATSNPAASALTVLSKGDA